MRRTARRFQPRALRGHSKCPWPPVLRAACIHSVADLTMRSDCRWRQAKWARNFGPRRASLTWLQDIQGVQGSAAQTSAPGLSSRKFSAAWTPAARWDPTSFVIRRQGRPRSSQSRPKAESSSQQTSRKGHGPAVVRGAPRAITSERSLAGAMPTQKSRSRPQQSHVGNRSGDTFPNKS